MADTPRNAPAAAQRRPRLLDWRALVGIGLSLILLYFAFRNMDFGEVRREIRTIDPLLLVVATAGCTFVFWLRAWRWKSILEPLKPGIPFRSRFSSVAIGFAGNNLLPARIGEFLRVYALSRQEQVTMVGSLASLVMERLLDGIMVIGFLFLSMGLPGFPEMRIKPDVDYTAIATGAGSFILVAIVILLLLVIFPRKAVGGMERIAQFLPKRVRRPLIDALEAFLTGVAILRKPLLLARAGFWSIVIWMVNAAGFYFAFRAFHIDLPFSAALFFQSVVALAVSIPSGPAFVGVYHYAAITVLVALWGVAEPRAAAYAITYHLAGFIPITAIGLYYGWRIGLSLGDVQESEETVEDAVEKETGSDRIIERRKHPRPAGPDTHRDGAKRGTPSDPPGAAYVRSVGASAATGARSRTVLARAKLNLSLRVLARDTSDYHQIETVFCLIDLADEVMVERGGTEVVLEIETPREHRGSPPDLGPTVENLAYRAARLFLTQARTEEGVRIRLVKRVPHGAGLGGGSSDAASVLGALNALHGAPLERAQLMELGSALGSDVPFFLAGAPLAFAWGRGVRMAVLPALPARPVLLAVSAQRIQTGEAYAALDAARGEKYVAPAGLVPLWPLCWNDVEHTAANDFEPPVFARLPQLAAVRNALERTGATLARLTGTGSTVFGVYHDAATLAAAQTELAAEFPETRFVATSTAVGE